jgi:hypothetical protein
MFSVARLPWVRTPVAGTVLVPPLAVLLATLFELFVLELFVVVVVVVVTGAAITVIGAVVVVVVIVVVIVTTYTFQAPSVGGSGRPGSPVATGGTVGTGVGAGVTVGTGVADGSGESATARAPGAASRATAAVATAHLGRTMRDSMRPGTFGLGCPE